MSGGKNILSFPSKGRRLGTKRKSGALEFRRTGPTGSEGLRSLSLPLKVLVGEEVWGTGCICPQCPVPGYRTVPLSPETVFDVLNEVKSEEAAVIVNESTSNTECFWQRIGLDRARSFYFPAAGALGFGIPAAVGVQLAEPGRPVIGVIGDGSANYAITGLWLILRNDEYGVLKWFAGALKATGLPGMDLPGIDYCAIAQGYGVRAVRIASRDELAAALVRSVAADSPSLIEVPIRAVG